MDRQCRLLRVLTLALSFLLVTATASVGQATEQQVPEPGVAQSAQTSPTDTRPSLLGTPTAIPIIAWNDAPAWIGKEVYLVGKVVHTGKSGTGHVFLNFDPDYRHTCTIFIRREDVKNFPESPQSMYRDKLIKVRGFLYELKGQPNLSLPSPERITVLPDNTPLPAPTIRPTATRPAVSDTITVGSYNLLNFFDAADDPYTSDETTGPKPQREVEALARSIRLLNADVLALVEVENRGVLQQYVDLYLSDMGYEVVEFEGNDTRGIDVAMLSRLPVGPVTSHRHLRFPDLDGHPTHFQRDLLEVQLQPPGAPAFEFFVVHLKSKGGQDDGGIEIRLPEARQARSIFDQKLKADPNAAFLLAGDFNDTFDSEPLKAIVGSGPTALTAFIDDLSPDQRVTYNQPPHRSMIDFILASPAMAKRYVPKSYNVPQDGSPEQTGSDHNPVLAKFRLK